MCDDTRVQCDATQRSRRRTTRTYLIRRASARLRESPKRRFILHVFPLAIFHCMKGAPGWQPVSVYFPPSFSFLVFSCTFSPRYSANTYTNKVRGLFARMSGEYVCVYVCVYVRTCMKRPFGIEKEGQNARRECEGDGKDRALQIKPRTQLVRD